MSGTRRNVVLGAILAALVATDVVLGPGGTGSFAGPATAVLGDVAIERAARITVRESEAPVAPESPESPDATRATGRPDGSAAAKVLDLVRGDDGSWSVVQRANFPAYQQKVDELLSRLATLSSDAIVSSEASSNELFGVGEDAVRVTVRDASNAVLIDVYMGLPEDEARGSYVRVAGEPEVYRLPTLPVAEARPVLWVDARVLDLDVPSVRVVHGELASGESFDLIRADDGRWKAAGSSHRFTPKEIDPLLLLPSSLYFEDVSELDTRATGLDAPSAKLRFDMGDGRFRELHLGGEVGAGRAATSPDWASPWVVVVPAVSALRIEQKMRAIVAALQ